MDPNQPTGENLSPVRPAGQEDGKLYYEPVGIPAEETSEKNGKVAGIFSVICAVISLIFIPILFGTVGIFLGITAQRRGQKTLGTVGVVLSSVFMVIGIIFGVVAIIMKNNGTLPASAIFFGIH
jgi:hypothetical protein